MREIHNAFKAPGQKSHSNSNSNSVPKKESDLCEICEICGRNQFHLVLIAEALVNRVDLRMRCGYCHASRDVPEQMLPPAYALHSLRNP